MEGELQTQLQISRKHHFFDADALLEVVREGTGSRNIYIRHKKTAPEI